MEITLARQSKAKRALASRFGAPKTAATFTDKGRLLRCFNPTTGAWVDVAFGRNDRAKVVAEFMGDR